MMIIPQDYSATSHLNRDSKFKISHSVDKSKVNMIKLDPLQKEKSN